uniref:RING-CH-type domain-containing protein n=1 Tax=viral metagenome TaxID=1070528 RepID=A0A6C0IA69_9ZZZZ
MAQCRICLDYEGEMTCLECKCTDNYVHIDCAYKWYASKTKITMTGYMDALTWNVDADCSCEICKEQLNPYLLHEFIKMRSPSFFRK